MMMVRVHVFVRIRRVHEEREVHNSNKCAQVLRRHSTDYVMFGPTHSSSTMFAAKCVNINTKGVTIHSQFSVFAVAVELIVIISSSSSLDMIHNLTTFDNVHHHHHHHQQQHDKSTISLNSCNASSITTTFRPPPSSVPSYRSFETLPGSTTTSTSTSTPSAFTISMAALESERIETSNTNESSHFWQDMYQLRMRSLNRSKLKQTSSISALMAGFALVALVEMDLYPLVPTGLLLFFTITSTLLVGVHMFALMISTCILPHFDALVAVETEACSLLSAATPHQRINSSGLEKQLFKFGSVSDLSHSGLVGYIDLAWSCSTLLGIFLFIIELAAILWVKFNDQRMVALVGTSLLLPILLALIFFVLKFYKLLMRMRFESAHREIDHLHQLMLASDLRQQQQQHQPQPQPQPQAQHSFHQHYAHYHRHCPCLQH